MFPVSQHHLIIQNKDGANVSSFAASPDQHWSYITKMAPMFPVSQHHLIILTKMAPMFPVSQHHLIIQNRDGANGGSFTASTDHTEQRWRQCFQFRSITCSYRTKMALAPIFPVSQHYLLLHIKAVLSHCWLCLQPHLVIQFKDGVHIFLRDGTGCLSTKKLSNITLFCNRYV